MKLKLMAMAVFLSAALILSMTEGVIGTSANCGFNSGTDCYAEAQTKVHHIELYCAFLTQAVQFDRQYFCLKINTHLFYLCRIPGSIDNLCFGSKIKVIIKKAGTTIAVLILVIIGVIFVRKGHQSQPNLIIYAMGKQNEANVTKIEPKVADSIEFEPYEANRAYLDPNVAYDTYSEPYNAYTTNEPDAAYSVPYNAYTTNEPYAEYSEPYAHTTNEDYAGIESFDIEQDVTQEMTESLTYTTTMTRLRISMLPGSLTYKSADLIVATKNFSIDNIISVADLGIIYKGTLPSGQQIGVMKISDSSLKGVNATRDLAKLPHGNLVKQLGYCFYGDEVLLVYEFATKAQPDSSMDKALNTHLGRKKGLRYHMKKLLGITNVSSSN